MSFVKTFKPLNNLCHFFCTNYVEHEYLLSKAFRQRKYIVSWLCFQWSPTCWRYRPEGNLILDTWDITKRLSRQYFTLANFHFFLKAWIRGIYVFFKKTARCFNHPDLLIRSFLYRVAPRVQDWRSIYDKRIKLILFFALVLLQTNQYYSKFSASTTASVRH